MLNIQSWASWQHEADVCLISSWSVSFSVHIVFSMLETSFCTTSDVSVLLLLLLHPVTFKSFSRLSSFCRIHPASPSSFRNLLLLLLLLHSIFIHSFSVAFILCMFCWMCVLLAIEGSAPSQSSLLTSSPPPPRLFLSYMTWFYSAGDACSVFGSCTEVKL